MVILLVCSGNTCRSPLAAVLLEQKLREESELAHITVESAGTNANEGTPASEGSYLVAIEHGTDLSAHRSSQLTREMMDRSGPILTMTDEHSRRVMSLNSSAPVMTLEQYAERPKARGIPDPYGSDLVMYRAVGDLLDSVLDQVVVKLRADQTR